MSLFRKAYSVVGVLLIVEFFAQFYFIAGAIFTIAAKADEKSATVIQGAVHDADKFAGLHAMNGTLVIPITILVLVALSFAARLSKRAKVLTGLLVLLFVIQYSLAIAGFAGVTLVAALHGVNALLLVGLGLYLAVTQWAFGRRSERAGLDTSPALVTADRTT
jgi:hypothetical protein